jgi:hypothetical protein
MGIQGTFSKITYFAKEQSWWTLIPDFKLTTRTQLIKTLWYWQRINR